MSRSEIVDGEYSWKTLYTVGGIAPLITIVFYVFEFAFIPWEQYPTSTEEWFELFQRSKLLGLFYLNALDVFSIMFLGIMFLALFVALRRVNISTMVIGTFFALLGVTAFVVQRAIMLSMVPLSDRYMLATTATEQSRMLAAGETLGALGVPTPQSMGFLFISIGVLIISIVMLRSDSFNKVTAYVGIGASLLTFADHISLIVVPDAATVLMMISGIFWLPWWVLIARNLILLGRNSNLES